MLSLNGCCVEFKDQEWEISQPLDTISLYSISGELDKSLTSFQKQLNDAKDYYLSGQPVNATLCVGGQFSGGRQKVIFDSLYVRETHDYGGESLLQIWGRRKPTEDELEYLNEYQKTQDEENKKRREAEYLRLKEEFGDRV